MPRLPPVPISPQTRLRAQVLARRERFGRDLVPVALELFGDELGETGERALPHFRARDADDAGVVGPDRRTQALTSVPGAAFAASQRRSPANRAADRGPSARPPPAAAEPTTNLRRERLVGRAGRVDRVVFIAFSSGLGLHDRSEAGRAGLHGPAAMCTAVADALIGAAATDVGHRLRRCPCRSASGFFVSSAAAAMIWPDWQ